MTMRPLLEEGMGRFPASGPYRAFRAPDPLLRVSAHPGDDTLSRTAAEEVSHPSYRSRMLSLNAHLTARYAPMC